MALGLLHSVLFLQARNRTLTGIRCLQNIQRIAYHSEVGAALDGEMEAGRSGEHALYAGSPQKIHHTILCQVLEREFFEFLSAVVIAVPFLNCFLGMCPVRF